MEHLCGFYGTNFNIVLTIATIMTDRSIELRHVVVEIATRTPLGQQILLATIVAGIAHPASHTQYMGIQALRGNAVSGDDPSVLGVY